MSFVRRVEKLKDQLICFQWMFQYQRDVIKVASTKAFGTHESNRFHSIDHCTRNTYHKQKNVRNAEIITPFQALIRQIWSSLRASLIDGEQPVTMILSPSQDNPFCLQSLTDTQLDAESFLNMQIYICIVDCIVMHFNELKYRINLNQRPGRSLNPQFIHYICVIITESQVCEHGNFEDILTTSKLILIYVLPLSKMTTFFSHDSTWSSFDLG